MPPRDGFTVTHFITVADIDRSADFYEKVFGGRILSRGDNKGASGHIQIANTWLIVNVGGGPTPDKPSVTLRVPADPDKVSNCTWRIVKMGRKSKHFALLIRYLRSQADSPSPKIKFGFTCQPRNPNLGASESLSFLAQSPNREAWQVALTVHLEYSIASTAQAACLSTTLGAVCGSPALSDPPPSGKPRACEPQRA